MSEIDTCYQIQSNFANFNNEFVKMKFKGFSHSHKHFFKFII